MRLCCSACFSLTVREASSTLLCARWAWVCRIVAFQRFPHPAPVCACPPPGAALGPLLAGLLSPSGWNNVFYMLMVADACALLVSLCGCRPNTVTLFPTEVRSSGRPGP